MDRRWRCDLSALRCPGLARELLHSRRTYFLIRVALLLLQIGRKTKCVTGTPDIWRRRSAAARSSTKSKAYQLACMVFTSTRRRLPGGGWHHNMATRHRSSRFPQTNLFNWFDTRRHIGDEGFLIISLQPCSFASHTQIGHAVLPRQRAFARQTLVTAAIAPGQTCSRAIRRV